MLTQWGLAHSDTASTHMDLHLANQLARCRARHPNQDLVAGISAERIGPAPSNYERVAAAHTPNRYGIITFCGATIVPVTGPDTGFVPTNSQAGLAVWSSYLDAVANTRAHTNTHMIGAHRIAVAAAT